MSFTINQHYCGGDLVDTSLFVKADTCMMEEVDMTSSNDTKVISDLCCKNIVTVIDGQDSVQKEASEITFQQQLFIATFFYTYSVLFSNKEKTIVHYTHYTPPILVKDILVLDETFLI